LFFCGLGAVLGAGLGAGDEVSPSALDFR